ncbi:PREDICTED: putative odorant receptor 85d [Polistes canadensis]|uniref:putative odorant receptor 85d n=1 Tax=Polistes canadensis TaxID=91411 RepID=UPI000718FA6C|nr:PREDICTED: putative odorant receptor 85d [Polistes canadensis]
MKYTAEDAIRFTKRSVALLISWPPSINESKTKLFFLDIYFWASFIAAQANFIALGNAIYVYRNNVEVMIRIACSCTAIIQMSIKMLVCRMQRSSLQSIVVEMENIVKQAKPYEETILTKYVGRCSTLHISLTFGFYLAATNIVLGPIFLPQSLPTFAVYPFNVEIHPTYEIVYFVQAISGIQASSGASIDCQVAVLLWFAGARFEMLQIDISNIVNEYDLKSCISKHRQIICYADNVVKTVRFVILTSVGTTTILIVFSGILLFNTDSVTIKFQFLVLDIVAIIQLFINSNPAENLIEMSSEVGSAAYNLNWVEQSQKISKNILFLIQRSQKPVIVTISGFLPILSLSYYMSTDSMTIKFQFLVLDIVAIIQLFINSNPAENLIETSSAIGLAAYNLNWVEKSQKMSKNILFLIQRSQKPVIIRINGFLPTLSLSYYMSFLSSSLSYFTTMRAAVN